MRVSTCMTAANAVVLAALICYYIHSYQHNTVDFMHYRTRLEFPAANAFMKYLYTNSFLMFVGCTILFILGVIVSTTKIAGVALAWWWLGSSVVLLAGAVSLLIMKPLGQWRRRAQ
jgi:hypothetical protein